MSIQNISQTLYVKLNSLLSEVAAVLLYLRYKGGVERKRLVDDLVQLGYARSTLYITVKLLIAYGLIMGDDVIELTEKGREVVDGLTRFVCNF